MSYFTKRSARIVAGSLAGALALSVTPIMGLTGIASAADALPPLADPIGAGNFCENAPTTEPFTDVSATDPAIDEIICLVATELTQGVTATTYEPNSSITRRQMALFIKRAADLANELDTGTNIAPLPAYDGVPDFLDVAGESTEVKEAIGQLVQADIVQGTTATTYSPRALVTRRQMAAFINRLQDFLTGDPFTTTGDFFNDDAGDTGEANLNAVASVGIFQGDGAGNVDPGGNLTRRQMAFVLLRHLQVNFDAGDIGPAFAPSTNRDFGSDFTGPSVQVNTLPADKSTKTITFTGLTDGSKVDIAQSPCYEVNEADGNVSLVDDFEYDGTFSENGYSGTNDSSILEIDGTDVDTHYQDEWTVTGTTLTVKVGNDADTGDCSWLLVWNDTNTDNEVSVDSVNRPTENFGAAGPIVFTRGEAPNAESPSGEVEYVDRTDADGHLGWFLMDDGYQYFYDAEDTPYYSDDYRINVAQFEKVLSAYDDLDLWDGYYSRTSVNSFDLYDDYGYPNGVATGVTAVAGDFDTDAADTAINDIKVSWTPPAVDQEPYYYCVDLYDTMGTATRADDAYYDSDCNADDTGDDHDMVFENEGNGSYIAYVYNYDDNSDSSPLSNPSAVVTLTVSTVPGDPVTVAAPTGAIHTDGDGNGYVSAGDTLVFTFNETMAVPAADAQITLIDGADGTLGLLVNGTNATFSKIAANRIAVIVTAPGPVILAPGTTPNLQYVGLTVLDPTGVETTGIKDMDEGNDWDVAGSGDINP